MRRSLRLREKSAAIRPEKKKKGWRKKSACPLTSGNAAISLTKNLSGDSSAKDKSGAKKELCFFRHSPRFAVTKTEIIQTLKEIKNILLALLGKKRRARLSRSLRWEVWRAHNGESETGKCFSCSASIRRVPGGWHCSHVQARAKGGKDTAENLRPCCPPCNIEMGVEHMFSYMARKTGLKK